MLPKLFFITTLLAILSTNVTVHSLHGASLVLPQVAAATAAETPTLSRQERRLQSLHAEQNIYRRKMEDIRNHIEEISSQMHDLKRQMQDRSATGFHTKKLSLISQQHTLLIEWEETVQKALRTIDTMSTLLREPEEFSIAAAATAQQASEPIKAVFSFEDIMATEQQVVDLHDQYAEVENNRSLLIDDISQRRKATATAAEEYSQKQLTQQQFITNGTRNMNFEGISPSQQGELLDLEERLAWYKRELAQARAQEAEFSLENAEITLNRLKLQLTEAKKNFNLVKKRAHISTEYVEKVTRDLNNKRQQSVANRENINEKIRVVAEQESQTQQNIRNTKRHFDVTPNDLIAIRNLTREPKTIVEWKVYAQLLALHIDASLHQILHEIYVAELEVNKAQIRRDELEVLIVTSWHRMTNGNSNLATDEDIEQEIKVYTAHKAELENQLHTLTRAREATIKSLHEFNASFDKLHVVEQNLTHVQHTLFKDHAKDYYAIAHKFESIVEKIGRRFDWVSRLVETYSTAIAQTQGSTKRADSIISELTSKSFWRRSDLSISWGSLVTFMPEMRQFFFDLFTSIYKIFALDSLQIIIDEATYFITEPLQILLLFVNLILVITFYFLLRLYLPDIIGVIGSIGQGYRIIHALGIASAAFLSFLLQHLHTVYTWTLLFVLIRMHFITSILIAQIFYLITIPYALWLVYAMINHWRTVNREKRYMFVSDSYEIRFFSIVFFMLSVLVFVSCIREAFLLSGYQHTQVPTILLALLFILGQVSLIGLLSRTQIVGMLQTDTPLLQWVYEHVSRYYYVLWVGAIGIIVMSNPYVGYGRQVFYIIIRLLFTATLIPFFSWIHGTVKNISLDLFFYYADRETLKERFMTGKFWYSMTVISSLILLLIAGIYFGAKLWGFPLTIRDLIGLLRYPLYTQTDEVGRDVAVTLFSLAHIVLYVLCGVIIAYCINTFVLSRALDPIIVESGVQNTVLTLMRYIIITIALFMGLTSAGLGGLTTKLAILFAGISFAVQDVVKDFLSYFILLVQRPVKVGDFIRVLDPLSTDENVSLMGFVRSITPRSIVLRKRNSTTVIIPNSRVVTNPVMNWSYTRGFFAFDDMRLTIPFGVDPSFVRQLMLEVLDKNPHVLKNPAPIARLDEFTENGYSFLLRGFLSSNKIGEQWDIASDIRLQVVKILRDNQIEVASPRRIIRVIPNSPERATADCPPM